MSLFRLLLVAIIILHSSILHASETPRDFKAAFVGDMDMSADSKAVLRLIKSEGADFVLHVGDLDYHDSPYH